MITEAIREIAPAHPERGLISQKPNFDVLLASTSKEDAKSMLHGRFKGESDRFESLNLALALSLYNLRNSPTYSADAEKTLALRLSNLMNEEAVSAHPGNDLPTIGIEVETPQFPYYDRSEVYSEEYAPFFDTIGMPRNKENTPSGIHSDHYEYWEFSPLPSFSAGVQKRILAELIAGGFIPRLLNGSKNPEDISTYLDPALISLHINLGYRRGLTRNISGDPEAERLGIALALAFTSPERILNRKSESSKFAQIKQGVAMEKAFGHMTFERVELKAMEVRTADTYRALDASQLLFGSYFNSLRPHPSELGEYWTDVNSDIKEVLEKHGYIRNVDSVADNREVGRLAIETEISNEIRPIVTSHARQIKKIALKHQPPALA